MFFPLVCPGARLSVCNIPLMSPPLFILGWGWEPLTFWTSSGVGEVVWFYPPLFLMEGWGVTWNRTPGLLRVGQES